MWMVAGLVGGLATAALAQSTMPAKAAPAAKETTTVGETSTEGEKLTFPQNVYTWLEQAKEPAPWVKLNGDLRMREVYANNHVTLNHQAAGHEWHFQRYRSRLGATLSPTKDIDFDVRFTWEFRNWCEPEGRRHFDGDEVVLDYFNVKWKNLFGLPATLTVGRQDIILEDGWLVLDGTPLDGSRTIFFDAARLQVELKDIKTSINLIYIDQHSDLSDRCKPFNDRDKAVIEQDEVGAILYVANKSLKDIELDAFYMYKNNTPELANGDDSDLHTFGARIAGSIGEHWQYRGTIAQQLGHRFGNDVCALGANTRLTYLFNDKWKNQLRVGYEFLSGDDPGTNTDEHFDLLWGRWPQFSELYVYSFINETRVADVTNLHRVGFGWTADPTDKIQLCADYHLLFADENTRRGVAGPMLFSDSGCFRGQLLTLLLRYKFNPHVYGHVLSEFFFPGDYYKDANNDPAVFLRFELTLAW